ncbi:MAG: hypothetical protein HJJLKODD_01371 [Phycisphaerae bacterium]|nr:hypothetical protein [Phycisphaerae bacterium]
MMNLPRLRAAIERQLAARLVSTESITSRFRNAAPWLAVQPQSAAEVVELVRLCLDGLVTIIPLGGNLPTLELLYLPDDRPWIALLFNRLNRIIQHTPEDLTVTLESGVTLAELSDRVEPHHQELPIDLANPEQVTVGGMVSANLNGPRRLRHGTLTDYLLGATLVLADGSMIKAGAKTVKNVAGYDLHKLLVGSFGSLGILVEVTLRLKPLSEDFRLAVITGHNADDAAQIISRLRRGTTRPALLELANPLAAQQLHHPVDNAEFLLFVGYEDTREAVQWQLEQLPQYIERPIRIFDATESLEVHQHLLNWSSLTAPLLFDALVLSNQNERFLERCSQLGVAAMAHIGSALIRGRCEHGLDSTAVMELRNLAGEAGHVRFYAQSADSPIDRWGPADGSTRWMRAIKCQFDPRSLLPWPGFLGPRSP